MRIPCTKSILPEAVPPEYQPAVKAIGLEAFLRLSVLLGGQSLYILHPHSLARNWDIRAQHNDSNPRQLAQRCHLSQRQIQKTLKDRQT